MSARAPTPGLALGVFLLLLYAVGSARAAPVGEKVRIAITSFEGKAGISQEKADVLMDMIAQRIVSLGDVEVITWTDVISILKHETKKRLTGCTDYSCVASVGSALDVRWIITGSVGRFGDSYLFNLKLIDVERSEVPGRVTRTVRGDEEDLAEELESAVDELLESVAEKLGLAVEKYSSVATRYPKPISKSPSAITVISREDIEATGATSVQDILRLAPGVEVSYTHPMYRSACSRLFWQTADTWMLVRIDGRATNTNVSGYSLLDGQPLLIGEIDRIEIIRGPGSSMYGANALAGVVSIKTIRTTKEPTAWVELSGGEPKMTELNARASTTFGDLGVALSGGMTNWSELDPFDRSPTWRRSARLLLEYRISDTRTLTADLGVLNDFSEITSSFGPFQSEAVGRLVTLTYEQPDLRVQANWTQGLFHASMSNRLVYGGVHLADLKEHMTVDGHFFDTEAQWTLPQFYRPLTVMLGGNLKANTFQSDQLLDADTFTDPSSSRYHRPGVSIWEYRGAGFLHTELAMTDWMTVTAGARLDYSSVTGWFLSPRLAAVVEPVAEQFLRAAAARSFREPVFMETSFHTDVTFPKSSPLQGGAQDEFREFMTKVVGNPDLRNEDLVSVEVGYLGNFLDKKLTVSLDLYWNSMKDSIKVENHLVSDDMGLPDLQASHFLLQMVNTEYNIIGSELAAQYRPIPSVSLLASWSYKQVYTGGFDHADDTTPKHLIKLGGRFKTPSGLIGSLYFLSTSEFWHRMIENPEGLLSPPLSMHLRSQLFILSRLGYRWRTRDLFKLEAGLKLIIPYAFSSPHLKTYERGGGETLYGKPYGAMPITPTAVLYLKGEF